MSDWRKQAWDVIRPLLSEAAKKKTREQAQALLSKHYPFGPRRHHPYRIWLKVVSEALSRIFGPTDSPSGEVRFTVLNPPYGTWFINVTCTWCNTVKTLSMSSGCIVCAVKRRQVKALVDGDDWKVWRKAMIEDSRAALVFADWLDDRGYGELGEAFRMAVEKTTADEEAKV